MQIKSTIIFSHSISEYDLKTEKNYTKSSSQN